MHRLAVPLVLSATLRLAIGILLAALITKRRKTGESDVKMAFLYLSPFLDGMMLVIIQAGVGVTRGKPGLAGLRPDFLVAYFLCWSSGYLIDHQSSVRLMPYLGVAWICFRIWRQYQK